MAYSKRTWVDRDVEYPNRRTLTNVSTGTNTDYDVAFNEGDVYVAGDKINATNINDLEDRIDNAFSELPPVDTSMSDSSTNPVQNRVIKAYVDSQSSDVSVTPIVTEGTSIATITVDGTSTTIKAPAQTSEIDDSSTASNKTWSANKISTELGTKAEIDDTVTSASKTWSSQKIDGLLILDVTSVGV